jgi:hypothetical protein
MAHKAHKLRLDNVEHGVMATMAMGFMDDLHETRRDATGPYT